MFRRTHRICPAGRSGYLESRLRSLVQNPEKILRPYIKTGMRVLDMGCGPGFFTIPMACLVGEKGCVVACDLQLDMLNKAADKIYDTEIRDRIVFHQSGETSIGLSAPFDFVLGFYVVHELPDQKAFFAEIADLISGGGKFLMVEPPVHVSRKDFDRSVEIAVKSGLILKQKLKFFLGKGALFLTK